MKIGDLVRPQDEQEWERKEKGLGVIINTNPPGEYGRMKRNRQTYQVRWTKGDYGTFWDVEEDLEVVCES